MKASQYLVSQKDPEANRESTRSRTVPALVSDTQVTPSHLRIGHKNVLEDTRFVFGVAVDENSSMSHR